MNKKARYFLTSQICIPGNKVSGRARTNPVKRSENAKFKERILIFYATAFE
jgi:hypothetical protein